MMHGILNIKLTKEVFQKEESTTTKILIILEMLKKDYMNTREVTQL
jgi:hypothetical protein